MMKSYVGTEMARGRQSGAIGFERVSGAGEVR